MAPWVWSCRVVGDAGVVFWGSFAGFVWSFCGLFSGLFSGLFELGGEFCFISDFIAVVAGIKGLSTVEKASI